MSILRNAVSKSKRRYQKNGFDLDLSYVTPNVIAMGFPSENVEAAYRNPMKEVLRFLDSYHKDRYKVYNLCSERGYDAQKFYNRVGHFPFDDHNAPPFELILQFCQNVQEWLSEHERNIAVIHCKAGKGRTGLMICAWLLFSREWQTPEEALNFYAAMRTFNMKGVTIPSQIRYVRYFHESLTNGGVVNPRPLLLQRVVFHTLPKTGHATDINFTVHVGKTLVFTYRDYVERHNKGKEEPKVVKVEHKKKKKDKSDKESKSDKEKAKKEAAQAAENGKEGEAGGGGSEEPNGKDNHLHPPQTQPHAPHSPQTPHSPHLSHSPHQSPHHPHYDESEEDTATFDCGGVPVCGDVKVDFEKQGGRIFAFWFNTAFVKGLSLVVPKEGLDKGHKDKHHKLYDENFRVELVFAEMSQESPPPRKLANANSNSSISSSISTTTTTTTTPTTSTTTTSITTATIAMSPNGTTTTTITAITDSTVTPTITVNAADTQSDTHTHPNANNANASTQPNANLPASSNLTPSFSPSVPLDS